MPPPMFTCSICGKEVSKPKSYFVGEGKRACRDHPGVTETMEKLEAQKKTDRENEEKRKEEERKQREQRYELDLRPCCWQCRAKGVYEKDFYTAMLLIPEKERLKGNDVSIFSKELGPKIRAALGIKDDKPFEVIQLFECGRDNPALGKMSYNARGAASIAGIVAFCPKCAKKFGFERKMPEMSFEQMMNLSVAVQPAITEAAQKMLDKEAQNN